MNFSGSRHFSEMDTFGGFSSRRFLKPHNAGSRREPYTEPPEEIATKPGTADKSPGRAGFRFLCGDLPVIRNISTKNELILGECCVLFLLCARFSFQVPIKFVTKMQS